MIIVSSAVEDCMLLDRISLSVKQAAECKPQEETKTRFEASEYLTRQVAQHKGKKGAQKCKQY